MDVFDEKAERVAIEVIRWLEDNCQIYEYEVGDRQGIVNIIAHTLRQEATRD